jgi:hypothetical protein
VATITFLTSLALDRSCMEAELIRNSSIRLVHTKKLKKQIKTHVPIELGDTNCSNWRRRREARRLLGRRVGEAIEKRRGTLVLASSRRARDGREGNR